MGKLNDYKCPQCKKVVEEYLNSTDPLPICGECGVEMQKIITANYKIRMPGAENMPVGKRYT